MVVVVASEQLDMNDSKPETPAKQNRNQNESERPRSGSRSRSTSRVESQQKQ